MTEGWRGNPVEQSAMSRFMRGRWAYGSVYVLDIDRLICRPDASFGILIEEKHVSATDRSWRVTQALAAKLGWWSALFVYSTDDGTPVGEVIQIDVWLRDPNGKTSVIPNADLASFDAWVCSEFGARPNEAAAA